MLSLVQKLYLKSSLVSAFAKIFMVVSALVVVWLVNLMAGKEGFGLFMIAFSLCQIVAMTLGTFFQTILIYYVSRDGEEGAKGQEIDASDPSRIARTCFTYSVVTGFLTAGFIMVLASPLAVFFDKPALQEWFLWMAFFVPSFMINLGLCVWYRARQNALLKQNQLSHSPKPKIQKAK